MLKEIKVVAGPHSHGLTVQLSEDVVVYVGLPAPPQVKEMTNAEIEAHARRAALRALKVAVDELQSN